MDESDTLRTVILTTLRRLAPGLAADSMSAIAEAATWTCVPGGGTLFKQGEPSDTVYLLLSGLLGVWVRDSSDSESMARRLGPGEIFGEMGCITGEARSATVLALRSAELLSIAWSDIERIATRDPAIMLAFCRIVIRRLVQSEQGRTPAHRPRCFVIVPITGGVDARAFSERFKSALVTLGRTFVVTRAECQDMTADELFQLETTHDHVLYLAEPENQGWLKFCLGQADAILLAASPDQAPLWPLGQLLKAANPNIPRVLALCWKDEIEPSRAADWIARIEPARHFHIRRPSDMQRMARLLTGRGNGLVLSGGGARGLAHIGVARALEEYGFTIDVVMGTSVGAMIGAGIALEWDAASLTERAHQFCRANQLLEITFPRLSLLAGRHVRSSLRRWFGSLQIEDTPIPYLCVSTKLNTAEIVTHRSGSLQLWTRASGAVPGVFPPVIEGETVHVDGGVLNNMPSDLIRKEGAGFVLGVDVGAGATPSHHDVNAVLSTRVPLNILELLIRVGCLGDEARWGHRRQECDLLIVPPLSNFGLLNFRLYEEIIEIGYRAALDALPRINTAPAPDYLAEAAMMATSG